MAEWTVGIRELIPYLDTKRDSAFVILLTPDLLLGQPRTNQIRTFIKSQNKKKISHYD